MSAEKALRASEEELLKVVNFTKKDAETEINALKGMGVAITEGNLKEYSEKT